MTILTKFFDFLDSRSVFRRIVLMITVWMTWRAFEWAAVFGQATTKTGIEIAAIIAAVTAPIAALQGFVFKSYSESRQDDQGRA